ncbi:cell division and transport-associated protein TolR [Novosphingobium sp. PhB165]|uniref:protein TolR n=1 Tax=Novosphingobium sp. PhB165 TaxID=2485105 RepID=UPI00104C5275|nr:protein TolR [Novosphingobium sp. PhB165]TCM19025.1 cell division and transport-associated protein TolR [Novosphingobium sp. PhB165]
MGMGMSGGGGRRGSRRSGGGRTPMAEINVTPLVDVMLVLLIIFMVTAPLMKAAVPIDLPDSRANATSDDNDQITISIKRDGTVYYETDALAAGELAERLAAVPADVDGKKPQVTLRADKSLDYGRVMEVMGELNHAGFTQIALVTGVSGGSGN